MTLYPVLPAIFDIQGDLWISIVKHHSLHKQDGQGRYSLLSRSFKPHGLSYRLPSLVSGGLDTPRLSSLMARSDDCARSLLHLILFRPKAVKLVRGNMAQGLDFVEPRKAETEAPEHLARRPLVSRPASGIMPVERCCAYNTCMEWGVKCLSPRKA